jgi:hypothetical protein
MRLSLSFVFLLAGNADSRYHVRIHAVLRVRLADAAPTLSGDCVARMVFAHPVICKPDAASTC